VNHLHVKRIHLMSFSYIVIDDETYPTSNYISNGQDNLLPFMLQLIALL
jgi:hypothetical protein